MKIASSGLFHYIGYDSPFLERIFSDAYKARNLIVVNNLNKENKKEKIKEYSEIIHDVKTKHNLIVNPSMISYVRDKLGICVKAKDNRYDPTQRNKRIPNDAQSNAIVNLFYAYQLA